jgi:teichuronic acid exporter
LTKYKNIMLIAKKNESIVKSILWSLLERYLPNIIQIISTIIIARLITPQEFGEVALITVFIQIASLIIASGFAETLIQRVKNTNTLYSTVFYLNLLFSVLLYCILFLLSKHIAIFYEINRLESLTKLVGLNIILYSFTYIQRVFYVIDGNFKTPAFVVLISALFGSITGILLAFKGYGVWSLVYQTLLINFIQVIIFWTINFWRPNFVFSTKELILILPNSSKILFNNIIQVLYDNLYTLVIGKAFSSKTLGFYNRIQTLVFFTTTNFMYAIETVFYPILCKKNDNINKIKESYEILLRISTYISFPVLVVLISLGEPLITIILSSKWIPSLQILKLISTAYLFIPIIYINNSFLKILNRSDLLLISGFLKKGIGILILFITIRFGFEVVMYGLILYSFIDFIISIIVTQLLLNITYIKQLGFILNNFILNIGLFFILNYTKNLFNNVYLEVFGSISIGLCFYIAIPILLNLKEFIFFKLVLNKQ